MQLYYCVCSWCLWWHNVELITRNFYFTPCSKLQVSKGSTMYNLLHSAKKIRPWCALCIYIYLENKQPSGKLAKACWLSKYQYLHKFISMAEEAEQRCMTPKPFKSTQPLFSQTDRFGTPNDSAGQMHQIPLQSKAADAGNGQADGLGCVKLHGFKHLTIPPGVHPRSQQECLSR